jgi:glycolate oxidase
MSQTQRQKMAVLFREFLPHESVIDQPTSLAAYECDGLSAYREQPLLVLLPGDVGQVQQIMRLCQQHRLPVVSRGAGTSLSGGALPHAQGVVLSLAKMNRILDIDKLARCAVVEPGVRNLAISEAVKSLGLYYAPDPSSQIACSIGGNVAENAGGGKAVKYGVTNRYVLGLEMVTPTGEIVTYGGKVLKDVTGYNMVQLMVGSEGTLGVFTKIIIKLLPAPQASVDLLCLFETIDQAIDTVPKIMTQAGLTPTAVEFMDQSAVRAGCEYLNETIPYQQAGAMLLITLDGPDERQVERDYDAVGEICLENGATEVYVADNFTTSERVWSVRRNIAEAFAVIAPVQVNEDLVVPPARVADFVKGLTAIGKKYDILTPSYGHAGDGNIHTRISPGPNMTRQKWDKLLPGMLEELYNLAVGMGGKLSGEHGIGHKRKKHVPIFLDEPTLNTMRAIKRAMDPNNILNPGKIFDL